jgi:hypothetical protein
MSENGVNGNVVKLPTVPDKVLKSLTDEELMLAYQCASALRHQHIPAAVFFDETGVNYDSQKNEIGRVIAITWLDIKGRAVITKCMSDGLNHFTLERVQVLASAVHQQFRAVLDQQPKAEPANDAVQPE